jgi:adenylate cyclase
VQQGEVLTWLGQPEEGIEWVRKAMRLNPFHPARFWYHLGRAFFSARRYAEAIDAVQHIAAPDHLHHALLAASHAQMGNQVAAARHARKVLQRMPGWRVDKDYLPLLHYKRKADLAHHREVVLKAGLPA